MVELRQHNKANAPVHAENTQRGAECVQSLPDNDALLNCGGHIRGHTCFHKAQSSGAIPTQIERVWVGGGHAVKLDESTEALQWEDTNSLWQ